MAEQYIPFSMLKPGRNSTVLTSLCSDDSRDINELSESFVILISNMFYDITNKETMKRHDISKQAFFSAGPTDPAVASEESLLLTCLWAENGTTLSCAGISDSQWRGSHLFSLLAG